MLTVKANNFLRDWANCLLLVNYCEAELGDPLPPVGVSGWCTSWNRKVKANATASAILVYTLE
jgi:hypothetical protein